MGRDQDLRAADADRERVAECLRKGHSEGRLDITEFQERLERCYQAKTFGELSELVRDLPRQDEHDEGRSAWAWRWRVVPLVPIVFALLLISAATGHHHVFWVWIPLLFLVWRLSWWRRRRWVVGARREPGHWI